MHWTSDIFGHSATTIGGGGGGGGVAKRSNSQLLEYGMPKKRLDAAL